MKQILYVEDSATSQLLMRKYVNALGELTLLPSPRHASTLLENQTFDLLITDFLFPDGDAIDLIQSVRRSDRLRAMPVLVVSGSMDGALLGKILRAGANDGLAKPLNTVGIRGVVERLLQTPYFRSLENALCGVCCFQWAANGEFHEFCPELGLEVHGVEKEEVARRMLILLQEKAREGARLGFTTHEKTVTHTVQTSPRTN